MDEPRTEPRRWLVTGGAGFIGTNACIDLRIAGHEVVVVDDLSRHGSEQNLRTLQNSGVASKNFEPIDIVHDTRKLQELCLEFRPDVILHLAAQTAVTTSMLDPVDDFFTNAVGTLRVLEAAVRQKEATGVSPRVLFSSTNKVYGDLGNRNHQSTGSGWMMLDRPNGISECEPLRTTTPYGISKLAADLMVQEYGRSFGLSTAVFRLSCVYGPYQNGTEDQGWISHFARAAEDKSDEPVTIYGDGQQVRDILWVADLVDLFILAGAKHHDGVFNVGGGRENKITVNEVAETFGLPRKYEPARAGDQKVYVSDIHKANSRFGWSPKFGKWAGLTMMGAIHGFKLHATSYRGSPPIPKAFA